MAHLDEALDRLQEGLDEQDLEVICAAAQVVLALCQIVGPGTFQRASGSAAAVAVDDPTGDALFDPDELGLEPEEFDVNFWRKRATG